MVMAVTLLQETLTASMLAKDSCMIRKFANHSTTTCFFLQTPIFRTSSLKSPNENSMGIMFTSHLRILTFQFLKYRGFNFRPTAHPSGYLHYSMAFKLYFSHSCINTLAASFRACTFLLSLHGKTKNEVRNLEVCAN